MSPDPTGSSSFPSGLTGLGPEPNGDEPATADTTRSAPPGESGMWRVDVDLPDRPYPVLVGPGVRKRLGEVLPPGVRRLALVTQASVPWTLPDELPVARFEIPDGEVAKSLAVVGELCGRFARAGITRRDAVVGLGGGVVTDVAGLAAALYHRGIPVVHVATTLLAQVDAAIGGKCGVNLPEGKNLVGAFWQPAAVLCDTETLRTLPAAELRSGRGELAKYAFLGVGDLETRSIEEQVAACVAVKASFVVADEREGGRRALLNYGHTLAHALEAEGLADGRPLRHGEAVGVGLAFAARLAAHLGRIDGEDGDVVAAHLRVLHALGLSERLPAGADCARLVSLMARDKKATDGLTFVLDGPAGLEVVPGVPAEVVTEVLASHPREPAPRNGDGPER